MNNTIYGGTTVTPTPISKIDQTYNPESENAQSGIAVAEAIEKANQNPILDYLYWEIYDDEAFINGCDTSIFGTHTLPDTINGCPVVQVSGSIFEDCTNLTSITIPDSINYRYLSSGAFQGCTNLESVYIGSGVKKIISGVFYGCTNLKSITIAGTLEESMGTSVFTGCTSLTDIYYGGSKESWESVVYSEEFDYNNADDLTNVTVHYNYDTTVATKGDIAEAITLFDESKQKNFEHIATITVTPDENGDLPTSIVFTQDSNGNSFELTDFYIRAVLGATDGTSARAGFFVNGEAVFGTYGFGSTLSNTALRSWYLQWIGLGENCGALCITPNATTQNTSFATTGSANINGFNGGLILPSFTKLLPVKKIELKFTGGTTKTFKEGSKFELWGVKQ